MLGSLFQITVLLGSTALLFSAGGFVASWPFLFLIPILCTTLFSTTIRRPTVTPLAFRRGYFDLPITATCLVIGGLSVGVLMLWFHWAEPTLTEKIPNPATSKWHWVILTALLFAVVNAVVEELYFREALFAPLRTILRSKWTANLAQAFLFGLLHWSQQSVPHGWSGFTLTLIFGLLLGGMRLIFEGLAAPIMVHTCADLGVFFLLVQ